MRSLEEVPEAWGNTGKSKKKVSFGAEKSDVPSKKCRKLDSKWENGKENRRYNGEKRERAIEKSPEVGSKTRKDEKKVDFAEQKTSAFPQKIARKRT